MPVNSRMSAPAMKPLFLAEISTSPRGGSRSKVARCSLSSASTAAESTFAEVFGLSKLSQAMPSASRSSFQAGAVSVMAARGRVGKNSSGRGGPCGGAALHLEVAHQRAVIGEAHVGDAKIRDLDALAHQHEIQFDARDARRKGRQPCGVGAAQPCGAHEEVDLVRAPESIEVAGDDHRLGGLADQVMERAQLVLA